MLSISALWPTSESLCIYSIFYTYICVMSLLLPSRRVDGHPHPKRGPRLIYRTNGFLLTCTTILLVLVFGGVLPYFHQFTLWRMALLVQHFWPLLSTVFLFVFIVATLLYIKGKFGIRILDEYIDNHTHGSFGLDFWVGR